MLTCLVSEIVRKYVSRERNFYFSVPQGIVLGPTLFLIYINNLDLLTVKENVVTFADDTVPLERYLCQCQTGFNKVSKWFRDNLLTLNVVNRIRPFH